MLLPTQHPQIRVVAGPREVEATFEDRRWVFPREIACLWTCRIPRRSCWRLYRRAAGSRSQRTGSRPQQVRLEVDDCFGNVAICELQADGESPA